MTTKQRTRPYNEGNAGAPSIAEAQIDFSAAAARQLIATLPIGAVILRSWIEVVTAFNATTSNLLTAGTGAIGAGTADDVVATVTEGTPGVYAGNGPMAALTAETAVYVYYTPGAVDASTGEAHAYIEYVRTADNG